MAGFKYTTLETSQIRVLTLLPGKLHDPLVGLLAHQIFVSNDGKIPQYEALSYVWGDLPDTKPMFILQDGVQKQTLIAPNLDTALRHLRLEDRSRDIWCDSVCINQTDRVERAAQILLMGDIYRKAERVLVWLGPEEDDSSLAIKLLDHIGANAHFDAPRYELSPIPGADQDIGTPTSRISFSEQEWVAIEMLYAREWFRRLWVRQEIALANPSAIVVAGYSSILWSRLGQAAGCLEVKLSLLALDAPFTAHFIRDTNNAIAIFRTPCFKHPLPLLNMTRLCLCQDDRDRIYSLLGLIDARYRITPDYTKSIQHVCREFMMEIYRQDARLDMLAFGNTTKSPSWIPDLAGPTPANHYWRNFSTGYTEAHLIPLETGDIEVSGIECGIVSKLVGYIGIRCSDYELKEQIKTIASNQLGADVKKWDAQEVVKLTHALLGGHWRENTNHKHDPPLNAAVQTLRDWVSEDSGEPNVETDFTHMLFSWATLCSLSGWWICQTTSGAYGICSGMILPGDHIYAILGCKDPIILRKTKISNHFRVVGSMYIHDFSCGQAILDDAAPDSTFVAAFQNEKLTFARKIMPKAHEGLSLLQIDLLYPAGEQHQMEDDHPLYYRNGASTSQVSSQLQELFDRGIQVKRLVLQ
jgi:hypothetical protein